MQHGQEFVDLFPVWDWQRIPGTTNEYANQLTGNPRRQGTTEFVGGVSDGYYGAAACDFARGDLVARKSWFFLDRQIVCLGAGISSKSNSPVITTVNQCRLQGDVLLGRAESTQLLEQGQRPATDVDYVWHDKVAYLFPEPASLNIQNQTVSGSWQRANHRYPDKKVKDDLFTVWIDHEIRPHGARYAYIVAPGTEPDQVEELRNQMALRIVSNTEQVQAIEETDLRLIAAAFYEAGKLHIDADLEVQVDIPCLLLIKRNGEKVSLTVSNPCNTGGHVRVGLLHPSVPSKSRSVSIEFPTGVRAGSSVTRVIDEP
jgi:chondroitin AC lyase